MIFNTWLNPLNRQTGLVILSLLLSPLCVVVNFSKGNLLNPLHLLVKAVLQSSASPAARKLFTSYFIVLFLMVGGYLNTFFF